MASSITALRVALWLPVCLCVPRNDSSEPMALTDDDLAVWFAANGLPGIASGDTGVSSKTVLGVDTTTSFSSTKTCTLSFELVAVLLFRAASLARFPIVGTLLAELIFFTSIGRAVTFRATMELLLFPRAGP
jgi:hypothetical protein